MLRAQRKAPLPRMLVRLALHDCLMALFTALSLTSFCRD